MSVATAELNFSYDEMLRIRKHFGELEDKMEIPGLLKIQTDSYQEFLQLGVEPNQLAERGIHAAFKSVFPIVSYSGNAKLEYVGYSLGEPSFNVKECKMRGQTYAVPSAS